MDLENSYCRLCAEEKPSNKQINLETDAEKKGEVIEKLTRINAVTDFYGDFLPRTVCCECMQALNKAFNFVVGIECAQSTLNQIFSVVRVKDEKTDFDYGDVADAADTAEDANYRVKIEFDDDENDEKDKKTKALVKKVNKPRKVRKKLDIDSIPLSQLSKFKLNWSSYSWYCTFCETQFSNIDELRSHSMACHTVCNPYRCTECKVRKLRLDSFLIHVQRHHKHLRYSCYKCFEQFNSPVQARKHRKTHLSTNFICVGCNLTFPNNEDLKKHREEFCTISKARQIPSVLVSDGLKCVACEKTFTTKSGLTTHLLIHTDRKKDHVCEVCGKSFYSKYNLALHLTMHKDERPFKCEICKASFKTERLLKNHVGVHNNDKPYSCNQCGRRFRLHRHLKSHRIIHTDAHPFACPHCSKRFRFKTILNNHIRLHTGVKPYSCEACQRDFTNWSNYNKHMKRKHNLDTAKKKHTPDGVYPIDPRTGAVIIPVETNHLEEWKKKILAQKGLGRPTKTPEELEPTSVIKAVAQ